MKNLLLIRHAKSSWDDPELEDRERPLTKKGQNDAELIGEILKNHNIHLDKIFCSSALRARMTIEIISKSLNFNPQEIVYLNELYNVSFYTLRDFLRELDDNLNSVAMVGHNPGLSELAHFLLYGFSRELPTCAAVFIELNIDKWSDLKSGTGILKFVEYPQKYRS